MSFKQRLKSSYTLTRFEFSWKTIPGSQSRDRKKCIHVDMYTFFKPDQISHTQSMVGKRGFTNRINVHTPMRGRIPIEFLLFHSQRKQEN